MQETDDTLQVYEQFKRLINTWHSATMVTAEPKGSGNEIMLGHHGEYGS